MIPPSTFLRCGTAFLSGLLLVQCSTTAVSLDYQPSLTQIVPGPGVVAAGRFASSRSEAANVLGEVRTPIGTPMDTIVTNIPVEEIVRNSFAYGLKSRNMLVSQNSAAYVIGGEILDFSVVQVVRPAAYARIRVNLIHKPTGHVVFTKIYSSERVNGPYLPGSGSPVPALRELGSRALQDVVDQALDDVGLRSRINSSGAR